ncbi:MAG: transglycosylase SLT domain-containing protein [Chitinivibrionales bacterium]|nr:transglycosylase SLT domain-containing protein [Chitinivibrionales bacterium]MBD3394726.1 transglycosylase SLT domain-containing protein [Chitinivibrionales bacterium]
MSFVVLRSKHPGGALFLRLLAVACACTAFSCQAPPGTAREAQPDADTAAARPSPARAQKRTLAELARQHARFNPGKWLQSDLTFRKTANVNSISPYDRIVKKMARRYGFDWRLISAQMFVESNFRNVARSGAGALGLMQVLPSTARFLGYDATKLTEPEVNIAVGCLYDQRMYSLWGRQTEEKVNRLAFALASYNAGRGRVLRSYSTDDSLTTWTKVHPWLPGETQDYVHKIALKYDFYKRRIIP